jgi:hypothetical protein
MRRKTKKPTTKKAAPRKTVRRKRRIPPPPAPSLAIDLEQLYKIINKVQIERETCEFIAKALDAPTFENILKNAELPYVSSASKVEKGCIAYVVSPGKERLIEEDTEEIEDFPDEILEDGQIFF